MHVYFDNSATTQPAPEVVESVNEVLSKYYGNPSSIHGLGVQAEKLLRRSTELISEQLGIEENELVFTSGGTESNNLAIKGIAFAYQARGRHLMTSAVEHSSVYEVCRTLEKHFNFEVTYLPVDRQGRVSAEDVKKAMREDTILVSIMHVNNELGSIQPVEEIGQIVRRFPKAFFHVDDVQGIGKVPLSIRQAHIDLLSLSGHKIHAPKGIGVLFVRKGIELYPLLHGGSQQNAMRSGTENVAGIVAVAKAIRLVKEKEKQHAEHFFQLKQRMVQNLEKLDEVKVNSPLDRRSFAPHIVNVSFPGIKPEVLVHALEEKGIFVSTKSACSSKIEQPSRILQAAGMAREQANSAIRISFSMYNTLEEVDYVSEALAEILPYYQKVMKV